MKEHPYEVGKNYLVRTVTMTINGTLQGVYKNELVFDPASWVADTGRFNECLKDQSVFNEVEPFNGPAIVGRGSIVDATTVRSVVTKAK